MMEIDLFRPGDRIIHCSHSSIFNYKQNLTNYFKFLFILLFQRNYKETASLKEPNSLTITLFTAQSYLVVHYGHRKPMLLRLFSLMTVINPKK